MSVQTRSTETTRVLAQASALIWACENAGIRDSAEIAPLSEFAAAAEERESALNQYRRAVHAHKRFAATHDQDDPAHEQHQRAVAVAQATLTAAEQIFAVKLAAWRKARGL